MKRTLSLLLAVTFLFGTLSPVLAERRRSSSSRSYRSSRPYYGGGKHTKSHGGSYSGGRGSSHKGGHYKNAKTGNRYGKHK